MGAQGIQVPSVKTVEEAAKAASEMRFYPAGTRGLGLTTRASGYCLTDYRDYINYVNEEFLSVIMIENKELADQVETICDIPQIDVLFVGTGDMSQSCGLTGETGHPEVQQIVKHVLETAKTKGKKAGIYAGTLEDAKKYVDMGFQYIGLSSEMNFIAEKLKEVMAGVNKIKESKK
jgi:4-hydroxy-2-oxoheptanedioate aldolase